MAKFNKSSKPVVDDVPTTDLHLPGIISRTVCHSHFANLFEYCHSFQSPETEEWHYGICNDRAKKAGMVGEIHPSSLDRQYATRNRKNG